MGSDIEETMSILSRRSRSTTPISATLQRSVSENRVTGNRITGNNHFTNPAFALETLLENTPYGSLDRRLKTKKNLMNDRSASPCERSTSSLGDYTTKIRD